MKQPNAPLARRGFMTFLGLGAAAGAGAAAAAPGASPPSATAGGWRPALEAQDDWLELPGRHRLLLDATTAGGAGAALGFGETFIEMNREAYKIEASDLAVVIVLRHFATPFAFKDPVWAKYGGELSKVIGFTDPKTGKPPAANLYEAAGYGAQLQNRGTTLDSLVKKGVRFAVCGAATKAMADMMAKSMKLQADAVHAEMVANLIPNGHLVPAGIVAVNRAQERGYALAYAG